MRIQEGGGMTSVEEEKGQRKAFLQGFKYPPIMVVFMDQERYPSHGPAHWPLAAMPMTMQHSAEGFRGGAAKSSNYSADSPYL